MRAASVICGLLAVGLLGLAGYKYAIDREPPSGAALVVHDPDRNLGSQPCETVVPVRFRLTNELSRPVRVVGLVPG